MSMSCIAASTIPRASIPLLYNRRPPPECATADTHSHTAAHRSLISHLFLLDSTSEQIILCGTHMHASHMVYMQ